MPRLPPETIFHGMKEITLPQGIKVDGFQPSAIPIRLEEILERQVEVEPKLEGKPADGFEVYSVYPNRMKAICFLILRAIRS